VQPGDEGLGLAHELHRNGGQRAAHVHGLGDDDAREQRHRQQHHQYQQQQVHRRAQVAVAAEEPGEPVEHRLGQGREQPGHEDGHQELRDHAYEQQGYDRHQAQQHQLVEVVLCHRLRSDWLLKGGYTTKDTKSTKKGYRSDKHRALRGPIAGPRS